MRQDEYFLNFIAKFHLMKTILIPIDFSDGTLMTCAYAIQLAGGKETQLFLYHIYPDQLMIPDSSFPAGIDSDAFLNTEFIYELRTHAEKNMQEFAGQVEAYLADKKIDNITIDYLVTGGDPEWEITEICNNINPEFIVMGTRGEGKKGFLEGSMAERIMIKAKVPVFAVPNSVEKPGLKNIMYATDFNESDYRRIQLIIDIFEHLDSNFHIVHFELKKKILEDRQMMDALKNSLRNEYPGQKLSFHLLDADSKSDALRQFTKEKGIELIAFIAHKTNVFQNLFSKEIHKKDFFKLELPMLALHEVK